jgi:hypothetical protein
VQLIIHMGENCIQNFGKRILNRTLRRSVSRCDDIKIYLKEAGWQGVDCIHLTQDKDRRWIL